MNRYSERALKENWKILRKSVLIEKKQFSQNFKNSYLSAGEIHKEN